MATAGYNPPNTEGWAERNFEGSAHRSANWSHRTPVLPRNILRSEHAAMRVHINWATWEHQLREALRELQKLGGTDLPASLSINAEVGENIVVSVALPDGRSIDSDGKATIHEALEDARQKVLRLR